VRREVWKDFHGLSLFCHSYRWLITSTFIVLVFNGHKSLQGLLIIISEFKPCIKFCNKLNCAEYAIAVFSTYHEIQLMF
jgi:hypothetical protein